MLPHNVDAVTAVGVVHPPPTRADTTRADTTGTRTIGARERGAIVRRHHPRPGARGRSRR